jgi:hypothetical protein
LRDGMAVKFHNGDSSLSVRKGERVATVLWRRL